MSPCNELEAGSRTHAPARSLNGGSIPPLDPKAFYFKRQRRDLLLLISFEMFSAAQVPAAVRPRRDPDAPPCCHPAPPAAHPNARRAPGRSRGRKRKSTDGGGDKAAQSSRSSHSWATRPQTHRPREPAQTGTAGRERREPQAGNAGSPAPARGDGDSWRRTRCHPPSTRPAAEGDPRAHPSF